MPAGLRNVKDVLLIVWKVFDEHPHRQPIAVGGQLPWRSTNGLLDIYVLDWVNEALDPALMSQSETARFVVGDSFIDDGVGALTPLMNGTRWTINLKQGSCVVVASASGLPPLYLLENEKSCVVATHLRLLSEFIGKELEFDSLSIWELGWIGHPLEHRTLFKRVSIVESGCYLLVETSQFGSASVRKHEREVSADTNTTIHDPIKSFRSAIQRIPRRGCFLTVTGGLDSRAIISELAREGRTDIPAFTISGTSLTLDARTAGRLCKELGFSHQIVSLNEQFERNLPAYCEQASLLSGGIASVSECADVHFYQTISADLRYRISGHLGNQVGRGSLERVSRRAVHLEILDQDLSCKIAQEDFGNWVDRTMRLSGSSAVMILIEQVVLFSSLANYSVGSHSCIQGSPYACRALCEFAMQSGHAEVAKSYSIPSARIRDLLHRFVGQDRKRSFQVALLIENGGAAASIPINWGWCASGFSLRGWLLGVGALLDATMHKYDLATHRRANLLRELGVFGLHEYKHPNKWLRSPLKTFVIDTLGSSETMSSGLFNKKQLSRLLETYSLSRPCSLETLAFVLDLVLARKAFGAKVK